MVNASHLNHAGTPIQSHSATATSSGPQAQKAKGGSRTQRLTKVAQEFEGILLSSLLEEIQKDSLAPSGASLGAGSETLRSLGTQAVAQALAQHGGVGIAKMIVRHFL